MHDIESWLNELGLSKYTTSFSDAEIDFDTLKDLQEEDLKELGLPLGPRRKVWGAIKRMSTSGGGSVPVLESQSADAPATPFTEADSRNEAERRHLTVMFVDLVGSTELSTLIDAEDVRDVITGYQNTVAGVISRYKGFVARYMGDGVLCYFGWPRANEDDAERAVRAGLSIIENVKQSSTPDGTALSTRVGIASGLVVVGDLIGSGASEEAAVVGETPNLAARLQSLALPDQLVLPEQTRKLLNDVFTLESTGPQSLKGIAEPVEAFIVTGEATRESRFEAQNTGAMTPLVGRDLEMSQMQDAWAQTVASRGQMILVSGEAGIGKSRFVQAAVEDTKQHEHVRITFQCSPYHSESAFYPIIHQMQYASHMSVNDSATERLHKLQALNGVVESNVPLLAAMLGIDEDAGYQLPELSPAQLRVHTLEALVDTLTRQAEDNPVLVVFEDLHWIDPTTLEFLDLAIDAIGDKRILLLATTRPVFTHGFGGHPNVRRFSLNRLGREQVLSIVHELTGGKSIPDEVLQIVIDRTDGVPLFVEELTKTIMESGVLQATDDQYILDGPLNALAIPNTLHDSLMARLDRLQPIKEVAQTASCIGREFPYQLLAQVSALSEAQLTSALEELISAELIYRRGVPPNARYQFKHALVRDAAYESLLKPRRRGIHTSILQALESDSNTPSEMLATHAEAAGLNDRAIELWDAASKAAITRPAFDEAIAHLGHAIRLITPLVDQGDNAATHRAIALQLQLSVANVTRKGIGAIETKNAFEKAEMLADKVEATPLRFSITYGLMLARYLRGDNMEAVQHGEAFVEIAEQAEITAPAVVANRSFGVALMNVGQLERAQRYFDRALDLFDPEQHKGLAKQYAQDLGVGSNAFVSFNLYMLGQSRLAEQRFRDCEYYASTCGDINSACYAHMIGLMLSILANDEVKHKHHVTQLEQLSTEQNLFLWKNTFAIGEGLLRAARGDETGIEQSQKADAALVASGSMMCMPFFRIETGRRAFALGRRDWADQAIESAHAQITSTDECYPLSDLYRLEATLAEADGKQDVAEQQLRKAIEIAQDHGAKFWQLRAAIDFAQLKLNQQQFDEGRSILQTAYNGIADGDCEADRRQAKELIINLST